MATTTRQEITLDIPPDKIQWHDDDPDDRRGVVTCYIFGTPHHLMLIPVKNETRGERQGEQIGRTTFADGDLDQLHALYQDCPAFQPVTIPGRRGQYVIYMHPFGD